jgi:hypothetical protein
VWAEIAATPDASFFKPMLKDAWGRVLTRPPQYRAIPVGIYLKRAPKHVAKPLGKAHGHGADGIDGKPVPADHWGIRGALVGMPGMPNIKDYMPDEQLLEIDENDHQNQDQRFDQAHEHDPFPGFGVQTFKGNDKRMQN